MKFSQSGTFVGSAATRRKSPNPPDPVVTYTESNAAANQRVEHGEWILNVDAERQKLHAQHHGHQVLETRRIPGTVESPAMDSVDDFALEKKDLVVINPGTRRVREKLDDEVAELVVIFPTNVWEYDVLDYFPFARHAKGGEYEDE